ncbi:MAG: hypothetical protein H6605_06210 [Flavobacteriales bacterium]|nr:hypothetical protein [Flavobacteriales bacterium]
MTTLLKKVISGFFISWLLTCNFAFSQVINTDSSSFYSQTITSDTILKPDYYHIEITYCEYTNYERKKRKWIKYDIKLDSIYRRVTSILEQNGQNIKPEIVRISNKSSNGYRSTSLSFQQTITLKIKDIETTLRVYDSLLKKLPENCFTGFKAFPKLNQTHIDSIVFILQERALEESSDLIANFALKRKKKIYKMYSINTSYYLIQKPLNTLDEYNMPFRFDIVLEQPSLTLSIFEQYKVRDQ